MSERDRFRSRLVAERWQFSRVDGPTFSANLRLLPNGRIGNYSHVNEHAWQLSDDGILEFCAEDGTVTTRFDVVSSGEGPLKLTGAVLIEPERAGLHRLEAVGSMWGRGSPLRRKPNVAVLIRTHLANEKLTHLIECLNGSPIFDVYVLADETRGKLPLADAAVPVLSHSVDMCRSLGLKTDPSNHENVLWLCGDYALYCGVALAPGYDYYIMIEYDVHFTRENPFLLEALVNRLQSLDGQALDVACSQFTRTKGDWYSQAARIYDDVYWGGLFAFIVASKRAVERLLLVRQAEGVSPQSKGELTHCETFVATTAMNQPDFRCRALGDILPATMEAKSYYASHPSKPNFLLGVTYTTNPKIEVVHPVLDADEYLTRLLNQHKAVGDWRGFIDHLNSLNAKLVPAEVKHRFLQSARALDPLVRLAQ